MKAPDKIYLTRLSYGAILGQYSDKPQAPKDGEAIEYIRRDAILEYINKEIAVNNEWKEAVPDDRFFGGVSVALENLKDKLDEL